MLVNIKGTLINQVHTQLHNELVSKLRSKQLCMRVQRQLIDQIFLQLHVQVVRQGGAHLGGLLREQLSQEVKGNV